MTSVFPFLTKGKHLVASLLFALLSQASHASWLVDPSDKLLSQTMTRWAQQEGRDALWQYPYDVRIADHELWNRWAGLDQAQTFRDALARVMRIVHTMNSRNRDLRLSETPLQYCLYDKGNVALLVKTLESDC